MPNDVRRSCLKYYGFQLFFNLILWVPVFYEIQKRFGLLDQQIFSIQSTYYLVFCFFELPTGFFADRFGYRKSLILGSIFLVLANLIVVAAPNFSGFLLHFMTMSLSRSLVSGAASAWLYDFLQQRGLTSRYKVVEGRARSLGLIAKVICWSAVGYLMKIHIMIPYWATAMNGVIALLFATTFVQVQGAQKAKISLTLNWHDGYFFGLMSRTKKSLKAAGLNRNIWLIIGQGIAMFVIARVIQVNIYQPLLGFKGFDVTTYGTIMGAMTLMEAFGSSVVTYVRRVIDDLYAVVLFNVLIASSLVWVALVSGAFVVLGFLFFSLFVGMAFPIQKQLLNDAVPHGGSRATILSLESIVDRLVSSVVLLPLAPLVATHQFSVILVWAAVFALMFTTVFGTLQRRSSGSSQNCDIG